MKRYFFFLIVFIIAIVLIGCSNEVKSIADCKEQSGKCYYHNESVKNDDSDISEGLFKLLLDDNHDMSYYYKANPIDDILWIEYETDVEISHNSFNEMISLFDDVIILVNNLYDISDIEFTVTYLNDIDMEVFYDNDNEIDVLFHFEEFIIEDSNDLSNAELVFAALVHIDDYSEQIKICLDYNKTTLISIFNVSNTRIYLEIESDIILYSLPTRLNTESFDSKFLEQFEDYNLVKYIDE